MQRPTSAALARIKGHAASEQICPDTQAWLRRRLGWERRLLCSQATADLVRDSSAPQVQLIELGPHRLPDLDRPEVVFQIAHAELPASFPRLPSVVLGAGNLPRQLRFVGHDEELLTIPALLGETPLVTLTGVGGVGKTRLAIEVATSTAHRYRDGAWLCELAAVRDADSVPSALLETFGIEPRRDDGRPDQAQPEPDRRRARTAGSAPRQLRAHGNLLFLCP